MEINKELCLYFEDLTGYKAIDFVKESIHTLLLKFESSEIKYGMNITHEKYDTENYNDFFSLVHGICRKRKEKQKVNFRGLYD